MCAASVKIFSGEARQIFWRLKTEQYYTDLQVGEAIFLRANLGQDGPGFRCRIGSLSDGPPHHDVACSCGNRFSGTDYADLVSMALASEAHAGSYDGKIVSQF